MKINCLYDKLVNVKSLKEHPKNRNKHPQEQIERLAKILDYQGWRYPIKVSKQTGFITAGHGRLEAARLLNLEEVPVNFQDYESDEQEYADLQADNSIASWAMLDYSAINNDIVDLGPDFNIDLLGIKNFLLEPAEKFLETELWNEHAEVDNASPDAIFKIIVSIENEPDVKTALELLGIEFSKSWVGKRTVSVHFPYV